MIKFQLKEYDTKVKVKGIDPIWSKICSSLPITIGYGDHINFDSLLQSKKDGWLG